MKEGKIRKFDDKEQTDREQTSVSTTESTLILSGSSLDTRGSWPTDGSKTETTLSSVDTR